MATPLSTFHPFPRLPNELQMLVWDYAMFSAMKYDYDHWPEDFCARYPHIADDHRPHPLSERQISDKSLIDYARKVSDEAKVFTTSRYLMFTCRLTRQMFLERWKKNLEGQLREKYTLWTGHLQIGEPPYKSRRKAILAKVTVELERLKR